MADAPKPPNDAPDVWPPPPAVEPPAPAARHRWFLFRSLWLDLPFGFVFGLFSFPLLTYGPLLPLAHAKPISGIWNRPWVTLVSSLIADVLHLPLFRSARRRSPAFASSTLVGALLAALLLVGTLLSSLRC